MGVSRYEEDVEGEAVVDELVEWIVLAPFAGVLAGMVWIILDHYNGFVGTDCDMGGCRRWGRPNFRCYRCQKVVVYFCRTCSRLMLDNLRQIGRVVVTCIQCAEVEARS